MRQVFLVPLLFLASCGLASADALVVTQAMKAATVCEIHVERGAVRVEFEIGAGELPKFRNLLPGEILEKLGLEAGPFEERFAAFFTEDFVLTADGVRLVPQLRKMEPRERVERDVVTGEPLPVPGEPEGVLFVELAFPFEGEPETIVVTPGRVRDVGFTTYHLGLAVMEFRYLSMPHTLTLDWKDPWYSQFAHRNLQRQYRYPISVFLYAEPYEIRVEIIARPQDLQQWTDLGLEGRETIPVEIQEELENKVAAFLAEHVDLTIDGGKAAPILDRVNFLERTLRSSRVIQPREELPLHTATLGAIFVQPINGLPKEARLNWDLFSPKLSTVSAAATDEAGPLPSQLTPDDPVLVWKNYLKNPTIPGLIEVAAPPRQTSRIPMFTFGGLALVCGLVSLGFLRKGRLVSVPGMLAAGATIALVAGAVWTGRGARPEEGHYRETIQALLRNVYHAFDFRGEEEVYDTLARSVHGPLLEQAYLEVRQGLRLANQGGARVKVKELEVVELEPLQSETLHPRFRCTWTVGGSVGHWGHIHQRRNKYNGELQLEIVDGTWKLTELELLLEERVQ